MGRLARKSLWLVLGRTAGDGLSFLYYLLLARTYEAEGIGAYSFAFAVAALAGLAVNYGFRHLLTREAARDAASVRHVASSVFTVQAGTAVVLGAGIAVGATLAGLSGETRTLLVLAFASVALQEIGGSFVAYLEGAEAMGTSAWLEVASRVVLFLSIIGLLAIDADLSLVMMAHVLAGLLYLMGAVWRSRVLYGRLWSSVDRGLSLRLVRSSLPFLAAGALYTLYARVDIIMLHHFHGEAETGLYAVAYKLVSTPIFVAFLIGTAVFPALVRSAREDPLERDTLFLGSRRWIALVAAAGMMLFLVIGDHLTVFLFGPEFGASGPLVRWMAGIFFAECLAVAYWRFLYALDREHLVLGLRAASVALNVVLNLLLIPRWGAYGAVWASLVSEGGLLLGLHVACERVVRAPYGRQAGSLLLVLVGTIVVGTLLRGLVPWPVVGTITAVVMVGLAFPVGILGLADLRHLRNTLGWPAT